VTTYIFADGGLINKATGEFEPFNRNAPVKMPRIYTGDEQEPTLSMADGKMYTSKAAMRASYKPSGNPQGESYIEVGDDQSYKKIAEKKRKPDAAVINDAVDRAFADLSNGRFSD
jgi:hypothetical protein